MSTPQLPKDTEKIEIIDPKDIELPFCPRCGKELSQEIALAEARGAKRVVEKAKELIDENERKGWAAALKTKSDAGAGYVIGFKASLEEIIESLTPSPEERKA